MFSCQKEYNKEVKKKNAEFVAELNGASPDLHFVLREYEDKWSRTYNMQITYQGRFGQGLHLSTDSIGEGCDITGLFYPFLDLQLTCDYNAPRRDFFILVHKILTAYNDARRLQAELESAPSVLGDSLFEDWTPPPKKKKIVKV